MNHIPSKIGSTSSRRVPKCVKCRNHGEKNNVKDHKHKCRFRSCLCVACGLSAEKQDLNARIVALRRQQNGNGPLKCLTESKTANKKDPNLIFKQFEQIWEQLRKLDEIYLKATVFYVYARCDHNAAEINLIINEGNRRLKKLYEKVKDSSLIISPTTSRLSESVGLMYQTSIPHFCSDITSDNISHGNITSANLPSSNLFSSLMPSTNMLIPNLSPSNTLNTNIPSANISSASNYYYYCCLQLSRWLYESMQSSTDKVNSNA